MTKLYNETYLKKRLCPRWKIFLLYLMFWKVKAIVTTDGYYLYLKD